MIVHQLPVLADNYIYILQDNQMITVIDPAESAPVIHFCTTHNLHVKHVLLTHHHPDHIGGVKDLVGAYDAETWGFRGDRHRLPSLSHELEDGQSFSIGNFKFEVKHTPGHTLGHICYFLPELKYLFCGDMLFSMGCGRFFEGNAEMALPNFRWIRSLPVDTTVFCAHEYTKTNTEFAVFVDRTNKELAAFQKKIIKKRASSIPTVPFPLSQEINLNPFLRWDDPVLRKNLKLDTHTDTEVLRSLREHRNRW